MGTCMKKLYIDTSALAKEEAVFGKLYPIVKKRIEDRCNTVCVNTAADADFILRFELDASVPAEDRQGSDPAVRHVVQQCGLHGML